MLRELPISKVIIRLNAIDESGDDEGWKWRWRWWVDMRWNANTITKRSCEVIDERQVSFEKFGWTLRINDVRWTMCERMRMELREAPRGRADGEWRRFFFLRVSRGDDVLRIEDSRGWAAEWTTLHWRARVCVCGPDSRRDLISWLPRAQLSLSKELFQLESTSYSGKIHISRLYYMKQDTLDSSGQIAPPG